MTRFSPDEMFGPVGALAAAQDGFEYRSGQLEMARAVQETFDSGGLLLAEAGTGTGKTLAYLVPAVQSGRRVVISTATRTLQEQIARKDVPFLADRLGLDFSALTMKGRENYLCLHRFDEFSRHRRLDLGKESAVFDLVTRWAGETETGDRAEVAGLPDRARFWSRINARADTCLGRRCPVYDDCHLVKMRRQAEQTQILIVNHALLFADLAVRVGDFGQVIPDHDCVVFDEAHRMEAIATQYFGRRLSSWRIRELADDAAREGGPALPGKEMVRAATDVGGRGQELFSRLLQAGEGRFPMDRMGEVAAPAVRELRAALSRLAARLGAPVEDDVETIERRAALRRRCDEADEDLEAIFDGTDARFVRWFETRGKGVFINASPIDVSQPLREHLFSRLRAAVLTSATLSVAGSFEFVRDRLGLDDAEEIQVASPFDYEEQGVLFLPGDLPEPSEPPFIAAASLIVRQLLAISEGRAFLLFTSFANLHAMQERLAEDTDYSLLVQGEAPRDFLLRRFTRTPRAVLLGTASFWEGVDVPGADLSLVVIDRLPFAVPSDPLLAARLQDLKSRGGDPFVEYQVPDAVLALKQGAGRLIRTRRDVGILCVLDPRLTRRRYGVAFLKSLPAFSRSRHIDGVAEFFQGRRPA